MLKKYNLSVLPTQSFSVKVFLVVYPEKFAVEVGIDTTDRVRVDLCE